FASGFAEPGENDGNAAANRLAKSEATALAEKQQRWLVVFLEVRHLCAVEIDLGAAPRRGDFEHRQVATAFEEGSAGIGCFRLPGVCSGLRHEPDSTLNLPQCHDFFPF